MFNWPFTTHAMKWVWITHVTPEGELYGHLQLEEVVFSVALEDGNTQLHLKNNSVPIIVKETMEELCARWKNTTAEVEKEEEETEEEQDE